ncbi:hypothetical protein ABZ705_00455 [Streptomyces sp. NPDC006984]|uniref:hypothetical protein n=1 Tax=Streptomyces sp. NPDC006984 TaxID=3155463 RepID=UPI0033E743FF
MSSTSVVHRARTGVGLRLLRAAVFAAVCVVLSGTGHALAACEGVPAWALAGGFAGVFALVLPFAGRQRSLPAIALVLTGGQLSLHGLFGAAQTRLHLAPTADDALIRVAAKLVCGGTPASLTPADARRIVTTAGFDPADAVHGAHAAGTAAVDGPLPSLAMLLAHLLAAVATGLLMRRGDRALVRLMLLSADSAQELAEAARLRSLRAALTLVAALCAGATGTAPAPSLAPPAQGPPPATRGAELQHTVIRRGPPPAFALVA